MCRMLGYLGQSDFIEKLLVKTQHSLIAQSISARETNFHVNGDGFGISWYSEEPGCTVPVLFKSVRPAWNDTNLKSIAAATRASCYIAHIRAATHGNVSFQNCHPFIHKNMILVHNGAISDFQKIKRSIVNELDDQNFESIEGQTDSEYFFALILHYLVDDENPSPQAVMKAMEQAIAFIQRTYEAKEIDGLMHINTLFTFGDYILAMRFTNKLEDPASTLYYVTGEVQTSGEHCFVKTVAQPSATLIASEKLDEYAHWTMIRENYFLLVKPDQSIEETAIQFQA